MAGPGKIPDVSTQKTQDVASSTTQAAKDTAAKVAQKAGDTASNLAHKAQDAASNLGQQARDVASNLGQQARELAGTASHKTDDALSAMGQGMSNLAGTIRQSAPREGMLGSTAGSVAEGLEVGGRYLREHGMSEIGDDLGRVVRQYPVQSLLAVFGVGFLMGAALRR
jgi:hypothetical protein